VFRATGGYTRRANSIWPLGPPAAPLRPEIDFARSWYASRGLPATFKMTPAAVPSGLDDALSEAGAERVAPTRVMVRTVPPDGSPGPPAGAEIELLPEPGPDWLASFEEWHPVPPDRRVTHRGILERIPPPKVFAIVRLGGEVAACGLASAGSAWVGLYDLVTDPARRGRGLGTRLVNALLEWGVRNGAADAYLQVEDGNEGARRLYERLGFRDAYPYWYRVLGPDRA
jgi:GNAT superfamily N-acetyltransferase